MSILALILGRSVDHEKRAGILSFLGLSDAPSGDNTRDIGEQEADERHSQYQQKVPYQAGGFVKMRFNDPERRLPPEHMWVKIHKVLPDRIMGELDNDPRGLTHIQAGDLVEVPFGSVSDYME